MQTQSLTDCDTDAPIVADLAIIGGGACGITLAKALSGKGLSIVVLESGGPEEDAEHEALNRVVAEPWSDKAAKLRDDFHRNLTAFWDGAHQPFGVRCRGLGGSTQAWAGKSRAFDRVDYAERSWVPLSGWPVSQQSLLPYIETAAEQLNLGEPVFDERVWEIQGRQPQHPFLEDGDFDAAFWRFARSRTSGGDIMRFARDVLPDVGDDVRVIHHASVTRLLTSEDGTSVEGLEAASLGGKNITIKAPLCVLASGAIENARLLLASQDVFAAGLGNQHDQVGRYLMDHPTTTIARARPEHVAGLARAFGIYAKRVDGHMSVLSYGLTLNEEVQREQQALNGAVFVTEERAADDPFAAMTRLARRKSPAPLADIGSILRSPYRTARGLAARAIERGPMPEALRNRLVETAIRFLPNTVARDFQTGRLPLKLSGLRFEGTSEQPPLADNRVQLSHECDALGNRLPQVTWRPGQSAEDNLLLVATRFKKAFDDEGLAAIEPSEWVEQRAPDQAGIIDMGHPLGTTRMSQDPRHGVVDAECRVHGVRGLYVAGGSVFPTSGHANPTMMMIALSLRLADHLISLRSRADPRV